MLTFEEKQAIIESFPELTRKDVSLKRLNYHYEESLFDKTVVVQHLHPNGNAFVYVAGLPGYDADDRGLVNVREASEDELREIIADSIRGLAEEEKEDDEPIEQTWINADGEELVLMEDIGAWNLYHGLNLEDSFGDYAEALAYLREEKFKRAEGGGDSK